tara:strand:+ start:13634 stop:13951 length:318 start_codon:yes stop_codon:yes gene_type:complete
MEPTFYDAVKALAPNAEFQVVDNSTLNWLIANGDTKPTDSQITTKLDELKTAYNNKKYQRDRQPLYPHLADFADAMYWNSKGDASKLTAYYAACEKVKSDNPKPT